MAVIISGPRLVSLKASIKAECQRRSGNGSVAAYGGTAYDYAVTPETGKEALTEHYTKLAVPMNAINPNNTPDTNGDRIIDEEELAAMEAKVQVYAAKGYYDTSATDCAAACTGLCVGCTGSCTGGCTGCSGCGSGCASGCPGCGSGCATGCTGCGSGCATACSSCGNACATSCMYGCLGCSGGCATGCTGCSGCSAACSRACSTACASSMS